MAFIPQYDNTDNSDFKPSTSNRTRQALTALVRVLARGAASDFPRQQTNEAKNETENIEKWIPGRGGSLLPNGPHERKARGTGSRRAPSRTLCRNTGALATSPIFRDPLRIKEKARVLIRGAGQASNAGCGGKI